MQIKVLVTVNVGPNVDPKEVADDIHDLVQDVCGGYIGNPDEQSLYGATLVSAEAVSWSNTDAEIGVKG